MLHIKLIMFFVVNYMGMFLLRNIHLSVMNRDPHWGNTLTKISSVMWAISSICLSSFIFESFETLGGNPTIGMIFHFITTWLIGFVGLEQPESSQEGIYE